MERTTAHLPPDVVAAVHLVVVLARHAAAEDIGRDAVHVFHEAVGLAQGVTLLGRDARPLRLWLARKQGVVHPYS